MAIKHGKKFQHRRFKLFNTQKTSILFTILKFHQHSVFNYISIVYELLQLIQCFTLI